MSDCSIEKCRFIHFYVAETGSDGSYDGVSATAAANETADTVPEPVRLTLGLESDPTLVGVMETDPLLRASNGTGDCSWLGDTGGKALLLLLGDIGGKPFLLLLGVLGGDIELAPPSRCGDVSSPLSPVALPRVLRRLRRRDARATAPELESSVVPAG